MGLDTPYHDSQYTGQVYWKGVLRIVKVYWKICRCIDGVYWRSKFGCIDGVYWRFNPGVSTARIEVYWQGVSKSLIHLPISSIHLIVFSRHPSNTPGYGVLTRCICGGVLKRCIDDVYLQVYWKGVLNTHNQLQYTSLKHGFKTPYKEISPRDSIKNYYQCISSRDTPKSQHQYYI